MCAGPGIALDLVSGKMYWSDGSLDTIRRANLDGSNVELVLAMSAVNISDIALDIVGGKIFWTDASTGRVRSASLADGSQIENLVENLNYPLGIALDAATGRIYWAAGLVGKIQRANLDGSGVVDLLVNTKRLVCPYDLTLDPVGGHLYWTDECTQTIDRANLDGSEVVAVIDRQDIDGTSPSGRVAVDAVGGKLYWQAIDAGVYRADLNGANVELLTSVGRVHPRGMALDLVAGKMYWMGGNFVEPSSIRRANLDGSDPEILVSLTSWLRNIALDLTAGKMYWGYQDGTTVLSRANLDGSDVEVASIPVEVYGGAYGIDLDLFSGVVYWTELNGNPLAKIRRANLDFSQVASVYTADGLNGNHQIRGFALDIACERRIYGDIDFSAGNNVVDLDDLLRVLQGFASPLDYPDADIYPCGGNQLFVDLDDLLAMLEAFAGNYLCPHACVP